jgi:hypothetical protein
MILYLLAHRLLEYRYIYFVVLADYEVSSGNVLVNIAVFLSGDKISIRLQTLLLVTKNHRIS